MKKGIDYTIEDGRRVMTREYLLKQGKCCKHNCRNCPWDYGKKKEVEKD